MEVSSLSDAELIFTTSLCIDEAYDGRFGEFKDPGKTFLEELIRRYKNKKNECEELRKIVAKQEDQMGRASFLLKFRHSLKT